MIYKVLTGDTHQITCRSNIRSTLNPSTQNPRLVLSDEEYEVSIHLLFNEKITLPDLDPDTCVEIIKYVNDLRQDKIMMVIVPEDMIG